MCGSIPYLSKFRFETSPIEVLFLSKTLKDIFLKLGKCLSFLGGGEGLREDRIVEFDILASLYLKWGLNFAPKAFQFTEIELLILSHILKHVV